MSIIPPENRDTQPEIELPPDSVKLRTSLLDAIHAVEERLVLLVNSRFDQLHKVYESAIDESLRVHHENKDISRRLDRVEKMAHQHNTNGSNPP